MGIHGLLPLLLSSAITATDGTVAKKSLGPIDVTQGGANLLKADGWGPWERGFTRDGKTFVCDNGTDAAGRRGATQTVRLDQKRPMPIIAVVWSKAAGVSGSADTDYSLYLDLEYTDGTPLWGQIATFATGTHGWQRRQVIVYPERPVKSVTMNLLLRNHAGKAWFRDPELRVIQTPPGTCLFDGVRVQPEGQPVEGFQVRDVAAESDFVRIERAALGLRLEQRKSEARGATFLDVTLTDTTGKNRAVTLVYAIPLDGAGWRWLHDPRRDEPVEGQREYMNAGRYPVGVNGRLSRYPFAAVARHKQGVALGIDMARPAFFRVGCNAGTGELFLAYDVGLTPEKRRARVRFCRFAFDPAWGFRSALAGYYAIFPEHFRCRTPEQGLWVAFADISKVRGWRDFGFKFKEGVSETAWDDQHGITTFHYTEPMTWWMRMPRRMPRTYEAALAEARRLATGRQLPEAQAFLTSGFHDKDGRFPVQLLDRPWCDGAVWSVNVMPGIRGPHSAFSRRWSPAIRDKLYGRGRKGNLDGEYIDSSEGYVTDALDFRRDHFAAAQTPLSFDPTTHRPAIFKGLVVFEYVRAIARDVRGMNKLMMANSTPDRLCWLAPMLDVMGTETDWNPEGRWEPMSDAELLYRRALCRGKPFCFEMNTVFERFRREKVEKYMKRCLAYGMFPGFFSHDASGAQYFERPLLYNRDRRLFRKYVPLCKKVAEAGWQPITLARSSQPKVYVERFGNRYLTVLNDSDKPQTVTLTLTLDGLTATHSRDLVTGKPVKWQGGKTTLALEPEDVAVIELSRPRAGTNPGQSRQ